ncbi:MAG: HEPN domain-containing protein [Clostridia bacterium]|nr:HEPN domain-containing protein [Clostridia bacterium]
MLSKEILDLANYRLSQAKENIEEAEILFNINKFKGASNRAYYAIFHAIKAILALEQKDFKKHSSVIAYFNQEYISKAIFPKELGRDITNIRLYREKSDYVDFYIITKDDCKIQIDKAKNIVSSVEEYLSKII